MSPLTVQGSVVCEKSRQQTRYPAPYTQWAKVRRGRIGFDWPPSQVEDATEQTKLAALPVDPDKPTSPWLTAPESVLPALAKVIGSSDYRGHEGVNTLGLNGCFWVRVIKETPGGVLIENLFDVGKIKVERVRFTIEPDLLYPLIRGRDVARWRAEPMALIILAQDPQARAGYPEDKMRRRWPRTYRYLKRFEEQLRRRAGYRKFYDQADPFYSMYDVGPYTLAEWRVVWPGQVAPVLRAAVLSSQDGVSPTLPDQTAYMISCHSEAASHFLASLLNSSPVRLLYRSVAYKHASMHFVREVQMPQFQSSSVLHRSLAKLSRQAHQATAKCRAGALAKIESEIDECAAKLWGLTNDELRAVQEALAGDQGQEVEESLIARE